MHNSEKLLLKDSPAFDTKIFDAKNFEGFLASSAR